jgi:DNA-binding XRE family transcriptional regulator
MTNPTGGLSHRQRDILRVIREALEADGRPPSMREIGDAVGLPSSGVCYQVARLEGMGYLHRETRGTQTLRMQVYDEPRPKPLTAVPSEAHPVLLRTGSLDELVGWLTARRRHLGLSQMKLSEEMGAGQGTVSSVESRKTDPQMETLKRYAAGVGVNLTFLLTIKEGNPDALRSSASPAAPARPPLQRQSA